MRLTKSFVVLSVVATSLAGCAVTQGRGSAGEMQVDAQPKHRLASQQADSAAPAAPTKYFGDCVARLNADRHECLKVFRGNNSTGFDGCVKGAESVFMSCLRL